MYSTNKKRIAKNTLLLYFWIMFVILVTLYTTRVLLNILGVVDYNFFGLLYGIFTISLVYSLHYYKASKCSSNLYVKVKQHEKFREIISSSKNKINIVIIATSFALELVNILKLGSNNYKSNLTYNQSWKN